MIRNIPEFGWENVKSFWGGAIVYLDNVATLEVGKFVFGNVSIAISW